MLPFLERAHVWAGGGGGWGMMLTFMVDATQHYGVGGVGNDGNVP